MMDSGKREMGNRPNGVRRSPLSVVLCGLAVAIATAVVGCATKGAKVVEGVDFTAGVDIPAAEGVAELSLVNYLSGFRLSADRNYGLACEFESTNTFSFAFGLYESRNTKRFKARCRPCWTNMPPNVAREPKTTSSKPPPDKEPLL